MLRFSLARIAIAALGCVPMGCAHPSNVSRENDRLRMQVIDLQNQIESLTQRNKELEQELRQSSTTPTTLPEEVRANIPHVTSLEIEKLSFARDTNGDNRPDVLTLYLRPGDSRARFVQLVGTINATATLIPTDADPLTIGRVTLTPSQLRDAYRSSLTGTHYTVELPINLPDSWSRDGAVKETFVRVIYTDGVTGQTQTAERSIALTSSVP